MYAYILGLLLLLGLIGLTQREHLAFTETIKDVRRTVDPAEQARIFEMAPASLQQKAIALNTAMKNPLDRSKSYVAGIVSDFQTQVYVPATEPITETVVDQYITEKVTALTTRMANLGAGDLTTPFYHGAYTSGEAKTLLKTYLGLGTPTATVAPAAAPATATDITLARALELFRDNLLEYKVTGNAAYKSVADGAKAWLDRYIATMNTEITQTADSISSQVSSYSTANADLTQTQADFQRVKTEGPVAEDTYITTRKQLSQQPVASDSSAYIKGGVAIGLVVGAIVLTLL